MKGFVKEMALNEFGHAVLCEALACVDDTAILHKNVLPEVKVRAVARWGCWGCWGRSVVAAVVVAPAAGGRSHPSSHRASACWPGCTLHAAPVPTSSMKTIQ